jgi:hypothetical protein
MFFNLPLGKILKLDYIQDKSSQNILKIKSKDCREF